MDEPEQIDEISEDDKQILASIIAERGAYNQEPSSAPADGAAEPPLDAAPGPLTLFSPDALTTDAPEMPAPEEPPGAEPARKRAPKRESTGPAATPWHFSEDIRAWSAGYATEADAILAARGQGYSTVWLGYASPITHDRRLVAMDALDLLGYKRALSEDQQMRAADAIIAAAAKVLGPAVRVEPKGVVDLNRTRPKDFDALETLVDSGTYESRSDLFAYDLAYVLNTTHETIRQMLERYSPAIILGVLRTMHDTPAAATVE